MGSSPHQYLRDKTPRQNKQRGTEPPRAKEENVQTAQASCRWRCRERRAAREDGREHARGRQTCRARRPALARPRATEDAAAGPPAPPRARPAPVVGPGPGPEPQSARLRLRSTTPCSACRIFLNRASLDIPPLKNGAHRRRGTILLWSLKSSRKWLWVLFATPWSEESDSRCMVHGGARWAILAEADDVRHST